MRVNILLSTFNGEAYLEELLVSLNKQTYKNIRVIVRDDGSTDSTPNILRNFAKKNNFQVIYGKNIGVIKSFYTLVKELDSKDELYAFCDQDDIWLPNKVERAVTILSKEKAGTLYCSNLEYVDENLKHIKFTQLPTNLSFNNAITENIAIGCTIMFDEQLKKKFLEADPRDMLMHDWWMYLLASTFGSIRYDEYCGILYRQHSLSVTPAEHRLDGCFDKLKYVISLVKTRQYNRDLCWLKQSEKFINTYPLLERKYFSSVRKMRLLINRAAFIDRLRFFINPFVRSNKRYKNYIIRLKILFGLGFTEK